MIYISPILSQYSSANNPSPASQAPPVSSDPLRPTAADMEELFGPTLDQERQEFLQRQQERRSEGVSDPPQMPNEGIAAMVGDEVISISEVEERVGAEIAQANPFQVRDILRETLDTMINEILIEREAQRRNITVSEEEIDLALEGVQASRGEIRFELLRSKIILARLTYSLQPDEVDIERAYRRLVRSIRADDRFDLAPILIRVPADADAAAVQTLKEKAEEIAQRAREGEDFAQLAREFSDDPDSPLSNVGHEDLPAILDAEVVMLNVGEVAGPIRAPRGFYILKIMSGEITQVRTYEEARKGLARQLLDENIRHEAENLIHYLRRQTPVEIYLE